MGFWAAISAAANPIAGAAAANQQGIAAGNQINTSNMLDAVQLYRQQAQDALTRQTQQANLGKIGADTDEAKARAAALAAPPPKGNITLGPGQNSYGPNGQLLVQGPPVREDPAVAATNRQAAALAAQAARQDAQIAAQSGNQVRAAAAKEYTDALTGYQQVAAANPSIKAPITTGLTSWATGAKDTYNTNEAQARERVKSAWQSYKAAGGNPADMPSLGLVSPPSAGAPAAVGAKPTAKDIVRAALNGQPLPQ